MVAASKLMEKARQARRDDRPADAREALVEAVRLCRDASDHARLIEALKALGQIERDTGHGEAARQLYEEAVGLCRRYADGLVLAHTVRHLGDIHQDAGHLGVAEQCYREALALYRGDTRARPLDLANAIRPLAILKGKMGEAALAQSLWAEARDLYDSLGVEEGVAESVAHLERLRL